MMRNIGYKFLSVLCALFLWLYVNEDLTTATVEVPVQLRNIPSGKVVLEDGELTAKVRVRGPSFQISSLQSALPSLKVRLPADAKDQVMVRLSDEQLDIPGTLRVLGVEPPEISLTIEDVLSRQVKVEVPKIDNLEPDLKIERIAIAPEHVMIQGPKKEVIKVRKVELFPLDVQGIRESGTLPALIRTPNERVKITPREVLVEVMVAPLNK